MGPGWSIYFAFIEGVCRVSVGILLVEFIWSLGMVCLRRSQGK